MSWKPLGLISPTPGTPSKITANFTVYNATTSRGGKMANALYFQVKPGNTGDVYIGLSNLNKSSDNTILAILRPPTANHLPDLVVNIHGSPNPFVLEDFRVDADQDGDGVRCSFTEY